MSRRYSRADMVLLRTAERKGWSVPDDLRTDALTQVAKIMATGNNRERLGAIKVLVAMDRVDQMAKVASGLPDDVMTLRRFLEDDGAL